MELDVQALIDEFGEYYQEGGQGPENIYQLLEAGSETDQQMTVIPTENTAEDLSESIFGQVLQAYQDDFTPAGGLEFVPQKVHLTQLKIDHEDNPQKLVNTWLGFLKGKEIDPAEWPYMRWLIEVHLIPGAIRDWEKYEVFKGVKAAIVAGTASAQGESFNGINQIRKDFIDSGRITPLTTGALSTTPATFCTQIEDWAKQIPEEYQDVEMTLNMSKTLADRYRQGYNTKYNANYRFGDPMQVEFANLKINSLRSMSGSSVIWATPKWNLIKFAKDNDNFGKFVVESAKRKVSVYSDWWWGIGMPLPGAFFTNNLDLPA